MSGFIEFCVELRSASEGGAAAEMDGEVGAHQQPGGAGRQQQERTRRTARDAAQAEQRGLQSGPFT